MSEQIINKPYSTEINQLSDLQKYVNKEVGLSEWTKITQEQINSFGNITYDNQWIHINPELCEKYSPYKTQNSKTCLWLSSALEFGVRQKLFELLTGQIVAIYKRLKK